MKTDRQHPEPFGWRPSDVRASLPELLRRRPDLRDFPLATELDSAARAG